MKATPKREAQRCSESLRAAEQLRELFQADGMISIHVQAIEEGPSLGAPNGVHVSIARAVLFMMTRAAKWWETSADFADRGRNANGVLRI